MVESKEIYSWLCIAIQQPIEDKSEFFYYDKKNKEFFSILILDYFLFDSKFNFIKGISPYYSIEELKQLQHRIKKINKNHPSIIKLPRFGIQISMEDLKLKISTFLSDNSIDIHTSALSTTYQKEYHSQQKNQIQRKTWWKTTSSLIHNIWNKIR